jgi:hypothetical protein
MGEQNIPQFRTRNPYFHYTTMNLPGSTSNFREVAPRDNEWAGIALLSEGFMIASLGLYNNAKFLSLVSCLDMSAVNGLRPKLAVGLNNDPGLRWQTFHSDSSTVANSDIFEKARELITSGFLVSVNSKNRECLMFHVFGHSLSLIEWIRDKYPGISKHDIAVMFISISPDSVHKFSYYQWDVPDIVLRQFDIWIMLDEKTGSGLWLQTLDRPRFDVTICRKYHY